MSYIHIVITQQHAKRPFAWPAGHYRDAQNFGRGMGAGKSSPLTCATFNDVVQGWLIGGGISATASEK